MNSSSTGPLIIVAVLFFSKISVASQDSDKQPTATQIATPQAEAAQAQQTSYFVTISLNGIEKAGVFRAFSQDGAFMLEAQVLERFGLIVPSVPNISYRGSLYFPLAALSGLSYDFDTGQQHLALQCEASCFPASKLTHQQYLPPPDTTPTGLFVNYDLLAEKTGSNEFLGGLAEIGVFSNSGSGTLTFSGRDFTGDAEVIRLDTNWTIDLPGKRQRWRFGDSITQHGGWGRASRFGGVQFGTDFGLQPGFISFPTPSISGGAALPSTAEIFVNGSRRGSIDLEPGPFTIEQPPVITGSGDLLVVVRDLLGRETFLSHPFYTSRNLLRPGLAEYSVETGFLRSNFGSRSNDYAEAFVSGSYRKGINQLFTAGLHAELSSKRAGVGPYIDWQTPFGGILSSAAALSVNDGEAGGMLQVEFNWEGHNVGFSTSSEWISRNFSRLGTQDATFEPRLRTSANLGFGVTENSSLSFNYLHVDERTGPNLQIASANMAMQINKLGTLSVNFSQSFGEEKNTAVFLLFTARLSKHTTGSASLDHTGNSWSGNVRASRNAPGDGGFGYRAQAAIEANERAEAGLTFNSKKGIISLDHSIFKSRHTTRLGLRGGAIMLGGKSFLSNPIDDSFALVKVGTFENVGVLRDNRPVTKTDKTGYALVSRLRPYEQNRISINPLDIPMSADIGTTSLMPVPRRRSGVIVDFPVSRTFAAMIKIVDSAGNPLPLGTVLQEAGGTARFYVGFNSAVYITGLDQPKILIAQTPNGRCTVSISALKASRFPARLGTLTCKEEYP